MDSTTVFDAVRESSNLSSPASSVAAFAKRSLLFNTLNRLKKLTLRVLLMGYRFSGKSVREARRRSDYFQ